MANVKMRWPIVGQKGANRDEHVLHLKTEAQQIMSALRAPTPEKKITKRSLPHDTAVKFFDSWLDWVSKEEARMHGDPLQEVMKRLDELMMTRQDASNSNGGSEQERTGSARSWAQVASGGSGRTGLGGRKPSGQAASAATTATIGTISNRDQCEIRIRMNNLIISEELRRKPDTPDIIIRTVNQSIAKSGNINASALTTASQNWIRAAKMLGSGDIFLYARDVRTKESLVHWKGDWIGSLGADARVQLPTYGVIMSDIPIEDTIMDDQNEMVSRFWRENDYLPLQGDITRIRWLGKQKEGKTTNAMVVEFEDSKVANGLLMTGTATWGKQPKKTQRYNRDCIITQCFKCHQYGHLAKACKAKEVCGYCSSKEHNTRAHLEPRNKANLKCALCGAKHAAWAGACPKRKSILSKIAEAKRDLLERPYFPEQVAITPGISGRTTRNHSDSGKQMPIGIEDDRDELADDGPVAVLTQAARAPERSQQPTETPAIETPVFDQTARGTRSSTFNYRAQIIPQTPSTRIFRDRVEASSPIQKRASGDMPAPSRTRKILGTRRRKTAASFMVSQASQASQDESNRTPLAVASTNRRILTTTTGAGGTKIVFESESEMELDMTQGQTKRTRTGAPSASEDASMSDPDHDVTGDTLLPCQTVDERDGVDLDKDNISIAESARDGGSEATGITTATKSSGSSESGPEVESLQKNTATLSYE